MWGVNGENLKMARGDYGIELPVKISGVELLPSDEIRFTLKSRETLEVVLDKVFDNIENNTFNLVFSQEDSDKLKVGEYLYSLDWYQNNVFMCNIIPKALFWVVNKVE